jgi:hypothetical protein
MGDGEDNYLRIRHFAFRWNSSHNDRRALQADAVHNQRMEVCLNEAEVKCSGVKGRVRIEYLYAS